MSIKKLWVSLLAMTFLVGFGYWGYVEYLAPPAATPTPTVQTLSQDEPSVVSAKGFVVPRREARLSFKVAGRLEELLVEEGDEVQAGQVIARLDDTELVDQMRQAQASLATAQAEQARVEAGVRSEEIAVARANLAAARRELERVLAGPKPEEVTAARAAMEKAAVALELAQAEYDKISWQAGIGATPQAVALEQATLDYEAAKAQYEALLRGATEEEIAVAQAQVDQAQSQLALLQAGPTAEELAVAQTRVEQAQAALAQAQDMLEEAELTAPFASTIASVLVEEGEVLAAGTPLAILADLASLRVETDDLSEVDIARVMVGQEVVVSVDALPDQEFSGRVMRIAPLSTTKRGDVTYTVTIELEEGTEAGLRWGMTSFVEIKIR
ncbi:MAG: HlyD family secretion protein [Anaerolineae bacterium]